MSNHIHLLGAEEVGRAARTMQSAAHEMQKCALMIEEALHRNRLFMEQWLVDLRTVIEEAKK